MGIEYVPAPIPRWELLLSYFVWIFHSVAAFVITYYACTDSGASRWIKQELLDGGYVSSPKMDQSDLEWFFYRESVMRIVIGHAMHSLGFYLILRFSPAISVRPLLIILGLLTQAYVASFRCVLILAIFTMLMTFLGVRYRSRWISWFIVIAFILQAQKYLPFSIERFTHYREFNIYFYSAIKILNFNLHLVSKPGDSYASLFWSHLLFMSYLPYSASLIVLFPDFQGQIERKLSEEARLPSRSSLLFGLRLIFWFFAFEFLLHFIHAHAFYNHPFGLLSSLNHWQIASISYVNGQYFYIKYVIIFGVPALFAKIDGMVPPTEPICISRVSKYSRMWRHFDRGLYQFLKHQVYIPLMSIPLSPFLSVLRGLGTLTAVFSVVIAWHGLETRYLCWVSLSAFELIIERIGSAIWNSSGFQNFRLKVGDLTVRRIAALSMLTTVIPGIFGVFFFLGQEGVGLLVYKRLLWQGIIDLCTFNVKFDGNNAGLVLLHLFFLGYFFNHVCLHLEQKDKLRAKKKLE